MNAGTPDDVLSAVRQLGIVDTVEAENLRCATIDVRTVRSARRHSAAGRARGEDAQESQRRDAWRDRHEHGYGGVTCRQRASQGTADSGFVIFGIRYSVADDLTSIRASADLLMRITVSARVTARPAFLPETFHRSYQLRTSRAKGSS